MDFLIKLTRFSNDDPVWVNPDMLAYMFVSEEAGKCTMIKVSDMTLRVSETPEEINELISQNCEQEEEE